MFNTCVTVASLADESIYFVFICALILYLSQISLNATAYGRSINTQGAGGAVGGTVDRQMLPGLIPTISENIALIACCTISSGITFQASLAVAFALCAPSICAISAHARIFFNSQASTNDLTPLMFLYSTLY